MQHLLDYILALVERGGPEPAQYAELNNWFREVMAMARSNENGKEQLEALWEACGDAFSVRTLQGFVVRKPHGYHGDFEIIDWIYTQKTADNGKGKLFDLMFHNYEASRAVRNRKDYFINKCLEMAKDHKRRLDILDIGCGPCRDILEMYKASGNGTNIYFHCVDHEPEAIKYANKLLANTDFQKNIELDCANVFRLKTAKKYDLIWSAGLFDYLDDRIAALLLKKIWRYLKDDGQIIFGNFAPENPTRNGMELVVKWYLIHRTADELVKLVRLSGVPFAEVEVESEPLGVNLFCVIKK